MDDKAIRSAKLTLGGMLEKRRAKSAVERAQGQIAPSKYLPGVPRQVHADGGKVAFMQDNHPDVPETLYHGNALKVATKGWTDEIDPEQTQRNMAAQDFRTFKPSEYGSYGPGIYLSDSPKVASDFAQGIRADRKEEMPYGQVMKLHVSMKQPFTDNALRHPAWIDYIKHEIKQGLWLGGISAEDRKNAANLVAKLDNGTARVRDLFLTDTPEGAMVNQFGQHNIHKTIRNSGFDGIIAHRPDGTKEYVAFKPEQVKSATGNRGTFDPTHPDMTFADGGAANAEMFQGIHPDLQNEEGKPMDLYHGTPVEGGFEAFDDAKLGQRDAGFYGRGHYLTPIKGAAEGYADPDMQGTGTIMGPMHAALKNPFVWDVSDPDKAHRTLRDLQSMGVMKHQDTLEPWDNLQRHHIDDFMRAMRVRGHDGVVFRSGANRAHKGISEIVVFKPTAIKHAEAEVFDPNDPRIRRAEGGKVDLYSKAAKIISGMKDQKMDVADILKYAIGKGAKKAELDHVDVPPGKATPKQVADHIEFMQPKIGVHKREGGDFRFDNSNDYLREMDRLHDRGMHSEAERLYDEFERFEGHGAADKPRYAQYQLPGGQNYREHILTLDNHPDDQTYMARNHWGKLANPLAHIRMSDRMIGGKKVLHVEEMQSDWNNDARRDGFRTGTEKADYDAYVAKMRQDMTEAFNGTDASPMVKASLAQKARTMDPYMLAMRLGRQAEHNEMARKANNNLMAPPRAPYINPKKDDWAELAMKHVLTEAAKGGYDGIAFTPDEAQSERWGGTDFSGIYNKKLPGMAQRLVQQHDPETDPDDMTHLQGWAVPMIPLSEKARSGIMQNGFSSFRRGGYVTHVRSAK